MSWSGMPYGHPRQSSNAKVIGVLLCENKKCTSIPIRTTLDVALAKRVCECGYKTIFCQIWSGRLGSEAIKGIGVFVYVCMENNTKCPRTVRDREQPVPKCAQHAAFMELALTP